MRLLWMILLIFSGACQQPLPPTPSTAWQEIYARDEGEPFSRVPLYRVKVPLDWLRENPSAHESIADTTKPNCTFLIQEGEQTIRITIHTFPTETAQQRIPPQAQIERWKNQFEQLNPLQSLVTPQSYGGFAGLCLEAQGILKGAPIKILGWSMQLDSHYYRQLSWEMTLLNKQRRADYTIKASGPPLFMDQWKETIFNFAHSFELITELPR